MRNKEPLRRPARTGIVNPRCAPGSVPGAAVFMFAVSVCLPVPACAAEREISPSPEIGFTVSTQHQWRLAGVSAGFFLNVPLGDGYAFLFEPGLSFTATGSSPDIEFFADASAFVHWNGILSGAGLDVSWKILRISDEKLTPTGVFHAGPSIESLFRIFSFGVDGPGIAIRPRAGLSWTFSPSGISLWPDWYLRIGATVSGRNP